MKNKIFLMIFFIFSSSLFAEKMILAPIIIYDHNSVRLEKEVNIEKILYEELQSYWFEGLVSFDLLKESDYGNVYTVIDANKACELSNSNYILYGYAQKNEKSWYVNLKLYGKNEKKIVKEFFASDEINQLFRMINFLKSNVISGISELAGIDKNTKKLIEEPPMRLAFPGSLYYWNPIDKNWASVLAGIIGLNCGLEFYPRQNELVLFGYLIDFSVGLDLSYSLALGKDDVYPLNYHTLMINTPALAHLHFTKEHTIYAGTGLFYEMEFLNVVKKYESTSFHFQNMFGIQVISGYEYTLNQNVSLRSDVRFDFHMNSDKYVSIKPSLGAIFYFKEWN